MAYALINGIILDGKEDMVPVKDKAVLVKDGRIADITDNERMLVCSGNARRLLGV